MAEEQPQVDPPYLWPAYASTVLRAPARDLVVPPPGAFAIPAPRPGAERLGGDDSDLTRQHSGEPLGERIIVTGRVLDGDGSPVANTLVEVWQANAAGRYVDPGDQHPAPLDPNFTGKGHCWTDAEGRYRFVTVKPGAYPWRNHLNAWRPAHIHFAVMGPEFSSRLVTQMYFPGDPLMPLDPILQSVPDPRGRARLVATFDLETTQPEWALGYRWDIVVRGRSETPFEDRD